MKLSRAILIANEVINDLSCLLVDASASGDRSRVIRLTEQIVAVNGLAQFAAERLASASSADIAKAMIALTQASREEGIRRARAASAGDGE
jgi:hypothetical protein